MIKIFEMNSEFFYQINSICQPLRNYMWYIELMRFQGVRGTSLSRPNRYRQIIVLELFYIRFNNGIHHFIQLCLSDDHLQ